MKTIVWSEQNYLGLDEGIRFAVKVLHAVGIETCQSCQGGKGHAYAEPTVDIPQAGDAVGFAALAALAAYGLPVATISITWNIVGGLPVDRIWRIAFFRTMEDRADDKPMFVYGYQCS